jgi:RsiW-degrading membrane proteinase PrsW (M82 family)
MDAIDSRTNTSDAPTVFTRIACWLRAQTPKLYWRVFAAMLIAYLVASQALTTSQNEHLLPLVTLLGGALVPVTFVVFCWEQGAFGDLPTVPLGLAFCSGASVAIFLVIYLEPAMPASLLPGPWLTGLSEEAAKAAAVIWFLRDRRFRNQFDGLVLGAAVGMGFAALETAGYGMTSFLTTLQAANEQGYTVAQALPVAYTSLIQELNARIELAAFGHGIWTAIVCAAIWRERGNAPFRLTSGVALAFGIAVTLHALWDTDTGLAGTTIAGIPLRYLLIGLAGIAVLRFFLLEAMAQARQAPTATPPAPLAVALRHYFEHLLESVRTTTMPVANHTPPGQPLQHDANPVSQ